MNSTDKPAQIAQDTLYEAGWEMTPSEAREQIDLFAKISVDIWLQSGQTDQFFWE